MPPGWILPGSTAPTSAGTSTGPLGPDDPVIQFYSDLNGSGGNFTWNVTLPVDRNATANQSDLYWAAEFVMTVTAPSAWMNECSLQLQLYPDASWYGSHSDNGNWIGAVIGWQVEASTGAEDPCFYSPLFAGGIPGLDFLNMSQGDRLNVNMTGWPGDPSGEFITIRDLTNGNNSYVYAFNSSGDYPLDPAYSANDVQDALSWGTGGNYPVFFGIITGKAGNPSVPANNTYGGCSPGIPPSTPTNPAVPCPSYDSGSWINDTLHPWLIHPPTFFNATTRSGPPGQVAFAQTYGYVDEISTPAGTACVGRLGSAYCSYPWYSYSCGAGAFEFGATDYPGVSTDFGKYNEYAQNKTYNAAHIPYYPVVGYSMPTCGGPSYSITLGSLVTNGTVIFLNKTYSGSTTLTGLAPGEYQLEATQGTGNHGDFGSWSWSGGVVPSFPNGTWTTVTITGSGSIHATPGTGQQDDITFDDSPSGEIAFNQVYPLVIPNEQTVKNGAIGGLNPGIYAALAYPPQGFEFEAWSSSNPGVIFAAPNLPFTSFVVTGSTWSGTLTANYVAPNPAQGDRLGIGAYDPANSTFGGGSVTLGGVLTTHSKAGTGKIPIGTYNLTAAPAVGYRFEGWYYTQSSIMLNFSAMTNITLENGTLNKSIPAGVVLAIFMPVPVNITFTAVTGSGGVVIAGLGYVQSGGVLPLVPGENYTASAVPGADWRFASWGPLLSSSVWNRASGDWTELLVVNETATVSVTYVPGLEENLTFQIVPVGAGEIDFNNNNAYTNGTWNATVAGGESYIDSAVAAPGFTFENWSTVGAVTTGPVTAPNSTVTTTGSGTLIATFVGTTFPITVLAAPPQPVSLIISGIAVAEGSTVKLAPGVHTIAVSAAGETFQTWSATPDVILSAASSSGTTVTVTGAGSLTAIFAPFEASPPTASPAAVDVGIPVSFHATLPTVGNFTIHWNGLPGCTSASSLELACTPESAGSYSISVTFVDAWGENATSPSVPLIVNPAPRITSTTLSLPAMDVGMDTTLTALESGGTGPFEWAYTGLPTGCLPVNESSLVCSTLELGAFNLTVTVFDAYGERASGNVTLTVNRLPYVEPSFSLASIAVGSSFTLAANAGGGTGPLVLSYAGLPPGCPATVAPSFTCTPTKTGTYNITVTVTDSLGKSGSQVVTLLVGPIVGGPKISFLTTEIAIGVLVLVVVALIAFVTLRRRPKKPTIVATPASAPPAAASKPSPPVAGVPEWSEDLPPPQEWHEDQ